jgi:branched-chain amino acid transport system substrate-binding protein
MRRILVLTLLLAVFAVAGLAQLTVGVNLSTTGPNAAIGIPQKNGIMLAAPNKIGGLSVKYVYLDDASDPTTAVQNVKRLISENHIDVLLGPTGTPTSMAVQETLAAAQVPAISFGSVSAVAYPVDAKRRWIFKTVANDDVFVRAMVTHMLTKGVKSVGIVAVNDPFGESWIKATTEYATSKGIRITGVERFERGDASATPQALRLIKDKPDAVLVAANNTAAITPHLSLIERGYKGKIYQSGGSVSPDFIRIGGKAVEGSYNEQSPFVIAEQLPDGYPIKAGAVKFLKEYEAKYGSRASYAAYGGDSVRLIEAAIPVALKKGKPGTVQFRQALRDALENAHNVIGLSAVFTMSPTDHVGINELGMCVLRVDNGQWKLEQVADFKALMKKK